MAKIVIYASALPGRRDALHAAAKALPQHPLLQRHRLEVSVMTPLATDALRAPRDSAFAARTHAAVEIAAPQGLPLLPLHSDLHNALEALCDLLDARQSRVLCGYHRVFRQTAPRALRYHYLMYRRKNFSRADYLDYYAHHHYRFGMETPGVDYYQTYVCPESCAALAKLLGLEAIAADSVSELHFDDIDAFLASGVMEELGPRAVADEERFVDRGRSTSFTMTVIA
ncbi:MAG: EthD domain-containing protein [Halioglobus sp.]|nr:EthD domain-containing protein [Halioglobus sp.]